MELEQKGQKKERALASIILEKLKQTFISVYHYNHNHYAHNIIHYCAPVSHNSPLNSAQICVSLNLHGYITLMQRS